MNSTSNTPSSQTELFTPIIESLAEEYGLVVAAVFGIVWRHCQLNRHVCDASHSTLAKKIGVKRRTIIRTLKKLCDLGLVRDITPPESTGGTRTYVTTVNIQFTTRADLVDAEGQPVTLSHTPCDSESHPPVTESHTKKLSKETKEDTTTTAADSGIEPDVADSVVVVGFTQDLRVLGLYQNKRTKKLDKDLVGRWAAHAGRKGKLPPPGALVRLIEEGEGPPDPGPARDGLSPDPAIFDLLDNAAWEKRVRAGAIQGLF